MLIGPSAAIALAAAVSSVYFAVRAERANRVKTTIDFTTLYRQTHSELRRWGEEVVYALSDAVHLCDRIAAFRSQEEFSGELVAIRSRLSALIDVGRFFFPNMLYGTSSETAYSGIRPPALDHIVYAYRNLAGIEYGGGPANEEIREALVKNKRDFTTVVQSALSVREMKVHIEQLKEHASAVDSRTSESWKPVSPDAVPRAR